MSSLDQLPTEAVGSKAERRHLTVLFCDIVGSTTMSTELDPEDLRHVLLAYQEGCGEAVRRYDGHIARLMGDGVLAYFGFPAAHEDDAERAVHAGLQMIEAATAVPVPRGPPLSVRVGIATGLVVVGDLIGEGPSREFALVGEAPNLAAWLQGLAQPNQILVSGPTRRLLGRLFELEDLGDRPLKGTLEPTRVWSVLRSTGLPTRFEAYHSSQLTPFVGRELELAVLKSRYERAKRGEGQVVAISGEPGIGKSRLIMALRQEIADEPGRTLLFQCSSYHQSSPWYPVIRHFEDILEIRQGDPPDLKLQKLEALVTDRLGGRHDVVVPLIAALLAIPTGNRYPPLELTPQQQKKRTFAALLELVRVQSRDVPVVLIGEDIHWMDPTTQELLALFRDQVAAWRVLIILSFRPEHRLPEHAGTTTIHLGRLEPDEAATMIDKLASGSGLPAPLIEQIVAKTDGVPLFVEEVTRKILDDRAGRMDQPGSGAWAPVVPETLHDSLMARLDQLAPIKTVAQVASAIGREFAFGVLEAAAPLPRDRLREAIDQLQTSGLLFRRETSTVETYSFKHALVQDAAYATMLRAERRKLHSRIAEILSTRFVDTSEGAPEVLAYHYSEAREARLAVLNWLKAGRQAIRRTAFVEAVSHFQAGLKLVPELPEDLERDYTELELQQALASATIAARGFGAAETMSALVRAIELCEKRGMTPQGFAALSGLVGAHLMRGEFEQARSAARDLAERAQRAGDQTARLMGHRILGMSLFVLGELDDAQRELREAIDLYDPVRHTPLAVMFSQDFKATAQAYLGLAAVLQGDTEAGLLHGREALAYAEELRHPHSICYVLPFLAGAYMVAGMPQAALPVAERTITLSVEYGFPQWLAGGLMLRGWARVDQGDVEAGLVDIRHSIDGLESTGTLIWMQFAQFLRARALAGTGDVAAALALIETILTEIGAGSGRWYEAEVHRTRGDLLQRDGRPGAAACYQAAIAVAERQGARLWRERAVAALAALNEVPISRS